MDIRHHVHVAKAPCSPTEWEAFRYLAEAENFNRVAPAAILKPRGKELNKDVVVLAKYESGLAYCGLRKSEIAHLAGPVVAQHRVCIAVAGTVARDGEKDGVLPPGVLLGHSWPGSKKVVARIFGAAVPILGPQAASPKLEDKANTYDDAAGGPTMTTAAPIDVPAAPPVELLPPAPLPPASSASGSAELVASIGIGEHRAASLMYWTAESLGLNGMILSEDNLDWRAVVVRFSRTSKTAGTISISFPITIFGPSYDAQRIYNIVSASKN